MKSDKGARQLESEKKEKNQKKGKVTFKDEDE
jgi:hypothetical protein